MKKLDLGQTITILANIGVVAGIIFLGVELQQNNELLASQARENRLDRQTAIVDTAIENPDLLELLGKDPESLTEPELDRLRLLGWKVLLAMAYQYGEVTRGLMNEEEVILGQRAVYHRPRLNYGAPLAWQEFKGRSSPEFVQWFEQNVID